MKLNKDKKFMLAKGLSNIVANVAKKPVFVVSLNGNLYDILDYYTRRPVIQSIPSKGLAYFLCDSFNKSKKKLPLESIQNCINSYSKHYYDCIFYKHTIKTTKDSFKKQVTITRLDISIEYLKLAVSQLKKVF